MRSYVRAVATLCAAAVAVCCGKKGPPLAPLVRIPAQIEKIEARRIGNDVYVTVTAPVSNIDGSTPADISRIEVYGYTGRAAPPPAQFAEVGALVAEIPVVPAPRPDSDAQPEPPSPEDGAQQGGLITIHDRLTPDELMQGKIAAPARQLPPAAPAAEATTPQPLRRFYMAVGWGPRAPGPPGTFAELPITPLPDPPPSLDVTYSASAVTVTWEPSGGILGFLLERTLPDEPSPLEEADVAPPVAPSVAAPSPDLPPGPTLYNIYRVLAPDPLALPIADAALPWQEAPPAPLNPAPVSALVFADAIEFGRERCYTVRALRGTAPNVVEGAPSPAACVTPIDIFPPAAPRQLDAVASEGAISLIWEPSAEPDAGGYVVLRGEAGSGTLQPLVSTPIIEARYRDLSVTPGKRYVYAVIALDNRLPVPNWSGESNRVEETAR